MPDESDTTNKLPKGTKYENGKVFLENGYRAVYTSDKKRIVILSDNGPDINGSYSCTCESQPCGISTDGKSLHREGGACCTLLIVVNKLSELTMQDVEKISEKLN